MIFFYSYSYSKLENLNYTQAETLQYTHLIMEAKNKLNTQLWSSIQEDFETVEFIDCFNSIGIQYNAMIPVKIKTKPCLAILKRKLKILTSAEVTKNPKEKKTKRSIENKEYTEDPRDALITKEIKKKSKTRENEIHIDSIKEPVMTEELKPLKIKKQLKKTHNDPLNNNDIQTKIDARIDREVLTSDKHSKEDKQHSKETIDKPNENQLENFPAQVEEMQPNLAHLLNQGMSLEDDAIVSTVESYEDLVLVSEEANDSVQIHKEINFQELHNLALGQVNRKTRATKLKIRKIIEEYYRSKGRHIENDSKEMNERKTAPTTSPLSTRQSVKAIIKQERIKEMIEQISTMDLTRMCNLEKVSTKDCLKLVIDKIDEDDHPPKTS